MTSDCLLAAYKICLDFNFPSKLLFPFIRENWGILTDFYPTVSDSIVQERHFFSCCKNLTVGPLDKCSSRASEQRPDSSILVSKPTESGQDQTCISLLPSTTISSLPTEFFLNQNCEKYIDWKQTCIWLWQQKNITTYFFGTILVQNGLLCTTSMTVLCPSWSYKGTTPPSA